MKPPSILKQAQTRVPVYTKRGALIIIEPLWKVLRRYKYPAANGVHQAHFGMKFHILVDNFSKNLVNLIQYQFVETAENHTETLIETYISHGKTVGILEAKHVPEVKLQRLGHHLINEH